MEAITDFFKELKARFSNPLFGSFIISWLIVNWQVPLGILGYKQNELKADGYSSYISLIKTNASWACYFWVPFGLAALYTIAIPIIKMLISALQSYFKKRSDNWNTKILKEYYVPMSKFVKQKELYNTLAQQLQTICSDESKTIEENAKLNLDVLSLHNKVSEVNSENHELLIQNADQSEAIRLSAKLIENYEYQMNHLNDISIVDGNWELRISYNNELLLTVKTLKIQGSEILIND